MSLPRGNDRPLQIDLPADQTIRFPYCNIWGWFETLNTAGELRVTANDLTMPFARVARPDLDSERQVGFSIYLDLPLLHQAEALSGDCIRLELTLDGETVGVSELTLNRSRGELGAITANNREKRIFLKKVLKPHYALPDNGPVCALPTSWILSPKLSEKKDPVSAHHYGPMVQDFLKSIPQDGFVLDAGAGLRSIPYHNVINLEIYEYPSTDVLAIGQELPFEDNTFDGVMSLAVLEHVDDPMRCASELARVLKPGGKALVMVPFLQAEHGYPAHYFNSTRFGVKKLFEGLNVERQFLEMSNHPINTLNEILSIYAGGLPEPERSDFLEMKIGDLISINPTERWMNGSTLVHKLSEEAQWTIAWGTSTIFVKP